MKMKTGVLAEAKMFLERADKGGGWGMMVLEWVFLF